MKLYDKINNYLITNIQISKNCMKRKFIGNLVNYYYYR